MLETLQLLQLCLEKEKRKSLGNSFATSLQEAHKSFGAM